MGLFSLTLGFKPEVSYISSELRFLEGESSGRDLLISSQTLMVCGIIALSRSAISP
ncbi:MULTISPECIES: hypothetical protein [Clostridium]|uniref:Uncharacterized protein n=1 Tax=Clostridium frigoriphilum TaxID=443253 RepID=A0ABU7UTV7_9CLOT|nr:hypothetical protein [Clostridium sp. DSM 17811]MBU3101617.1 hypothetical protein [Clostridium sp. DSM 17811]